MLEQAAAFRAKGFTVKMTVEKGQYHVISTLTGDGAVRLFKEIEAASKGCVRKATSQRLQSHPPPRPSQPRNPLHQIPHCGPQFFGPT